MKLKMRWSLPITLLLLLVIGFGSQISQVQAQTQPDFCINIGGGQETAFGLTFLADNSDSGDSPYFSSAENKFGSATNAASENMLTLANVPLGGNEADIFQTERYGGAPGDPAMVLELGADLGEGNNLGAITTDGSLPNGNYIVDLYFAEAFVGVNNNNGAGARIFDVTLEGTLILDDLDIFTVPDPDRPLTGFAVTNAVTVADGSLTVEFSASADNAKLSAVCVRPDTNTDTEAPVISVLGADPVQLVVGDNYIEPGATATDNEDSDIILNIVPDISAVDTSTAGSYTVTYMATDADGNFSTATRTVNVSAVGDDPPTLAPLVDWNSTAGDSVAIQTDATDDGSITYSITGAPAGISIDSNGLINGVVGSAGTYPDVTVTVDDGVNPPVSETFDWLVIPAVVEQCTVDNVVGAINLGEGQVVASNGITFVADASASSINATLSGTAYSPGFMNGVEVHNTDDDELYRSERYGGAPTTPAMTYDIIVPNGDYVVELYIAEIYTNLSDSNNNNNVERIMDVSVEGTTVFENLHLYQQARALNLADGDPSNDPSDGRDYALPVTRIIVTVSDGELNINISSELDNGKISAFCIGSLVPENTPPVAEDDTATTNEDVPALISVLLNDSDAESTPTIDSVDEPSNGSVVDNGDGTITYTPDLDYNGGDSFTYTIIDDGGLTDTATVTVTITAINDAPVAVDDADTTDEDVAVIIDVLSNDTDVDVADVLTIDGVGSATNGSVVDNGDGTVTYTPNLDYNGSDSFTYTVSDGDLTADGTVTVTVNPINDAPVAVDDADTTDEDVAVTINILSNDTDVDSVPFISAVATAANGNVIDNGDGTVTYTPEQNFNGTDSFLYTVSDGELSDEGMVTISVGLSNDPPVAVDDTATTDEDVAVTVSVLLNDSDVDVDDVLTVTAVGTASNGTVSFDDSSVTYTPNADFNGTDSFTYTVSDSALTDTATVNVTVTAINDVPVVSITEPATPVSITEGDSLTFTGTASDVEDGDLSASLVWSSDLDGVLANGAATFDTSTLSVGSHIITAQVSDSELASASATVAVTVGEAGIPSALVEINPNGGLNASTFSGSSYQITNNSTGGITIDSVVFDLSTAILPDMVFDPVGAGGDATSSCLTPNSGATATGFVAPSDPCADPFSVPRNGGFDVMIVTFNDFDATEQFFFTTDIDPNNIQGVAGAGNAGAVSGYELVGSTITVTFSDGSVIVASLYEDGSLGGSQAIVTDNATSTPSILAQGVSSPSVVNDLNQIIEVTGTPGDFYSLLQMDTRLFIASGDPPFDVSPSELPFYANEAMSGKVIFNGQIDGDGTVEIPVTMLVTASGNTTPDGGLNSFIAVTSNTPYAVDQQVSQTSNIITLKYEESAPNVAPTIDFLTPVSSGITVEEDMQVVIQFSVTDDDNNLDTVDVSGGDFISVVDGGNGIYTATFSPDADDAGVYTITVTATDTELASTTGSFTLTVTEEALASLSGSFTTQARAGDYDVLNTTVTLYPVGSDVASYTFTPVTSGVSSGSFVIEGIEPGTYQVGVKVDGALQGIEIVTLTTGANNASFGILRAGDANGDNVVTALDFSLLAGTFNKQEGDVGYNGAADFNADGAVTSLDFSLLASNFNTAGDMPSTAP